MVKNRLQLKQGMLLAVAIVGLVAFSAVASADVYTFKQGLDGYTGTGDTTINNLSTAVDNNYGSTTLLDVGGYTSAPYSYRRSLIRFDLSGSASELSPGIESVTLRVYVGNISLTAAGTTNTLQVYAVNGDNAAWDAGNGSNSKVVGAACWNDLAYDASDPTAWTPDEGGLGDPGGGYAATPLASANWTSNNAVNSSIDLTFSGTQAQLTALINSFTNSTTNAGLILRSADESYTDVNRMIRLQSSDSTQAYAPELIVTTVPEPATMALLGLGGVGMLIRRRRR